MYASIRESDLHLQAVVPMTGLVRRQGLSQGTVNKAQKVSICGQVVIWPVCWEALQPCTASVNAFWHVCTWVINGQMDPAAVQNTMLLPAPSGWSKPLCR